MLLAELSQPCSAQACSTSGRGRAPAWARPSQAVQAVPQRPRLLIACNGLQVLAGRTAAWESLPRRDALLLGAASFFLGTFTHAQALGEVSDADVKKAVKKAFEKVAGKGKAPVLLRLVFHDAGTHRAAEGDGGANASIRYELDRPENYGLSRGWRVVTDVMAALKGTAAEGRVTLADLVYLGGAYAVAATGGPAIDVPIGRVDADKADPVERLPAETFTAQQLLDNFAAKGISSREFVALSGAHTLGSKGFGDPLTFDNTYFKVLLERPWLDNSNSMAAMIGLASDHVLPDDPTCRPAIEAFAASQSAFFKEFQAAYVKLSSLGAQWA